MSQNTEGPVSNEDIGPLTAYANFVIRQRWWLIVFTVVAALVVISGARFIGFDNDYRVFFPTKTRIYKHLISSKKPTPKTIIFFS